MRPTKTYDQERLSLNLAKLKKGGENFEIIIDPDKILEYKKNKEMDPREVMMYEKIFADAKKGFEASHDQLKALFNTTDVLAVAKKILDDGEIQFTQEYREDKRKEKKNKILDIITRNAVDPKTGLPHPRNRIEAAMEEARVKIDDFKEPGDQVNDIVSSLKPIIPIKLATKEIQVKIPSLYAGKAYSVVDKFGKIKMDNWLSDGSWLCSVEIPAGIQNEFFDALNKLTQGNIETKIVR
ncbi:ribosome assembly factor SBDS [Candidatus Woesearchaeota archaeon]|nr:ribosome assembly factor SBDS [Candidatus Woesearchaeota archaeon]